MLRPLSRALLIAALSLGYISFHGHWNDAFAKKHSDDDDSGDDDSGDDDSGDDSHGHTGRAQSQHPEPLSGVLGCCMCGHVATSFLSSIQKTDVS